MPEEQAQREYTLFKAQHPPQELPETGIIFKGFSEGLAPLEIVLKDTDIHYYIKLVDLTTNNEILHFFIKAGNNFSTQVPLGTFEIKYAVGTEWFGEEHFFGPIPYTMYFKADEVFRFRKTEKGYEGYTIELFPQYDGNLDYYEIPEDVF